MDRPNYLSLESFRTKAKNKEPIDSDAVVCKMGTGRDSIKAIDEEARTIDFIISTGAVDRDGDTINPKGWDLKNFRKNPVVLWAHNNRDLPIGKASKTKVSDGDLISTAEFTTREENPLGDTVFRLYQRGFMHATSVGFLPREWEFPAVDEDGLDEDGNPRSFLGMDFKKQELMEYSCVPVPSNPEALVQARSKGIDTEPLVDWIEQALDEYDGEEGLKLWVPRSHLEKMWKNSKSNGTGILIDSETRSRLAKENMKRAEEYSSQKEAEAIMDTITLEVQANVKELTFDKDAWEDHKEALQTWAKDNGFKRFTESEDSFSVSRDVDNTGEQKEEQTTAKVGDDELEVRTLTVLEAKDSESEEDLESEKDSGEEEKEETEEVDLKALSDLLERAIEVIERAEKALSELESKEEDPEETKTDEENETEDKDSESDEEDLNSESEKDESDETEDDEKSEDETEDKSGDSEEKDEDDEEIDISIDDIKEIVDSCFKENVE